MKLSQGKISVSHLNSLTTRGQNHPALAWLPGWFSTHQNKQCGVNLNRKKKPNQILILKHNAAYQVPNLTSHKQMNFVLNSLIPLEVTLLTLCMQLPISRRPHIIFPAIKPSRNMVLLIECLNITCITPRILLFISDLVNGFNDDKKSLEILSKSTLHGMGNSSTGLIR